jgi:hypothetical protein
LGDTVRTTFAAPNGVEAVFPFRGFGSAPRSSNPALPPGSRPLVEL